MDGWTSRPRRARIAKNAATLANIVTVLVSPRGLFPQLAATGNSWFLTTRPPPLRGCWGRDRYTHARRQARTGGRRPDAGREGQGLCRCQKDARHLAPRRSSPFGSPPHFFVSPASSVVSLNIYSPFPKKVVVCYQDFFFRLADFVIQF